MLRRVLFAALLGLSIWMTADRMVASAPIGVLGAETTASNLSDVPDSTDSSDHRWIAGLRASASINESGWRTQPQCSKLRGASGPAAFDAFAKEVVPAHRAPSATSHLHRIPLLI